MLVWLLSITIFIKIYLHLFLYCIFKIYSAIRPSIHKCVINSVFSIKYAVLFCFYINCVCACCFYCLGYKERYGQPERCHLSLIIGQLIYCDVRQKIFADHCQEFPLTDIRLLQSGRVLRGFWPRTIKHNSVFSTLLYIR